MYGKKSLVFGLILSGLPVVAAAEQLVLGIIGDTTRIAYLDKTFLQPFTKSTGISVKIASISENDGGDEVERAEFEESCDLQDCGGEEYQGGYGVG